jgi:hypothetical protein
MAETTDHYAPANAPAEQPDAHTPFAILAWSHSGATLFSRRSQALADYWAAMAHSRQPEEAVEVQIDYCRRLIDDYAAALSEATAPFVSPPEDHAPGSNSNGAAPVSEARSF